MREVLYGGVTDENVLAELERGFAPFIDHLIVGADTLRDDINKISFLGSDVPFETIRAEFADAFDVIPTTVPQFEPNSGELAIAGVHKAGAIEILLAHLGIPVADTMAYGDGHNDLEMLDLRHHRRGHGQRPPEGQGRRRRHHRQPRRGRPAHQLHQVRSDLINRWLRSAAESPRGGDDGCSG